MKKIDPMRPSPTLLIKLGSALVHAEEIFEQARGPLLDSNTLEFDMPAFKTVSADPEVVSWVKAMSALLPRKRSDRS